MSFIHEHRLLRKTIQALNAQRLKGNPREKPTQGPLVLPGVNATSTMKSSRPTGSIIDLTKPTVTNLPGRTPGGSTIIGRSPRAMQQNAARQQNIYQANLAKNAATVSSGLKPQTSQYINVETPGGTIGYDAAQYKPVVDENGVVTRVTQNTDVVQPTQPTNPVRTLVDRGMFKPSETNPTKLVLDESKVASKVEERRNQRLIDMGVDPNSEVVKLIEQGGKYDGTDAIGSTPYIRMPDGTRVAVEGYSGEKIQTLSNNKDQFDTATIKNEVKDEFKDTYTGTDSSVAGTSQGTQATTTDTTGMSGSSTSLATQAGLGQKYDLTPFQTTQSSIADLQSQIKNLSPDLQAAVLPSLMALQASSDLSMKTAAALISNLPTDQEITAGYGTLENYILDQDTKYKDIIEKNKQQSLAVANYNRDALELEKKLNDHNAYVAEQQQAQKNIDTEKGLRRQINKLGIQTDTSGLDYLNTQLQRGVDALNNLKTANSLVSLRAQLAIGEGYKLDVKNALNTYEANYLQISSQTAEALRSVKKDIAMRIDDRDKEIRSILEKAVEKKSKNDADAAEKIYNANIKMIEDVAARKSSDLSRENLGWQLLNTAVDNYGQDVPRSILDRITTLLPDGTDLQDILSSPTLAQKKKGGSGSRGTSVSPIVGFSISERDTNGTPLTLNKWLEQRESDFHKTRVGPISPDQIATWTKEYNAKLASESVLSPASIMKEWRVKSSKNGAFSTLGAQKIAEENVTNAINRGDYQEARAIVDSIGKPPPEKTIAQVTSAERVLNDLSRMEVLLQKIEGDIGAFPTKGALWKWMNENIETTPEYAELRQLIDSNVAPYARGISGERGATTEPDVQRSLSSLIDVNSDAAAVRASLASAKRQAHESISIYLQGMRDGGYSVNNLQNTYTSGSYNNTSADPSLPSLDQAQKDWLYSQ